MRVPSGENGASTVEYGLLAVAIAAVITVIVFALGTVVGGTYQSACDQMAEKTASAEDCRG